MKRIFYILILAALAAVSCAREALPDLREENGFEPGQTGLVMRVVAAAPDTKVTYNPYDKDYNEYKLEQFYYFIYQNDPSVNTTEAPVSAGKWALNADASEGEATAAGYTGIKEKIVLDDLTALKQDENTYGGYVYVIANYKNYGSETTLENWDKAIDDKDFSSMTWETLQALRLPVTIGEGHYDEVSERLNEKADGGYRFKPQESFIMASAPTAFTVNSGEVGSVDAALKRLAAKISIDINMAQWYAQYNNSQYKYTWYSDPERAQVYLNYAANTGTLSGKPLTAYNSTDFTVYRRFSFLQDATAEDGTYTAVETTYDEQEPLVWKHDADLAEDTKKEDGQWYTSDEDKVGKIVEVAGEIQYRTFSRPAYKITGTPFYSYPYDFSGDSGHAPFFKVIVEWTAYNESAGTIATDTQKGTQDEAKIYAREYFYKISLPEKDIDKNDIPRKFEANHWYKITLNLSVLGSEADETSIDVSGNYYVVDWSDPSSPAKPELNAGRYLSVTSKDTDSDGNPLFYMYGDNLEIPISTSHAVNFSDVTNSYKNFYTGNSASLTLSPSTSSGSYFTITSASDYSSVTLSHVLETNLDAMKAWDVAVTTYQFTIKHTDNDSYSQKVTIKQYPSLYIDEYENSDYSLGNPNRGKLFVNGVQTNTEQWDGTYNWRNAYSPSNPKMYIITTTVLDSSLGYILGDPRDESATSLTMNATDAPDLRGTSRKVQYYYGTSRQEQTRKMVAPSFRIASYYGSCPFSSSDYNDLQNRCAGYQEDGYPAGRWRVPTQSELEYITTLSAKNMIPKLFNTTSDSSSDSSVGSVYWSAHGQVQINGSDGSVREASGSGFVRCVYDEWYWGSDRIASPTTFTWGDEPR